MSLIITSNRLSENKGVARGQLDNENPANYKNFFRSPIEIEPNSEIAVESVKMERNGNVQLNDNSYVCHYWGRDPETLPEDEEYDYLNSISRNIPFKRGTYNFDKLPKELQKSFKEQYADPRIHQRETITMRTNASTGREEGLDIKFHARGTASGTEVSGSLTAQTVFNLSSPSNACDTTPELSNEYTWTPGTGVVAKTGLFQTQFSNASAVVQLKGRPFGLNQGKFDVSVISASQQRWAVGLSRPQLQYRSNPHSEIADTNPDDLFNLDRQTEQHQRGGRKIIDTDGDEFYAGPWETYDYAVIQSEGVGQSEILVVQRAYDPDTGLSRMEELEYWNASGGLGLTDRMSYSDFYASFDGVRFEGAGDEIKLYFKQKGKSVYTQVLGSNLEDTVGKVFTPIGDTSYALYPMFNLGLGSMTVTKYESNFSNDHYKYPTFTNIGINIYTPGDDMFSNQAPVMRPGVIGPFNGIPFDNAFMPLEDSSYNLPPGRELVANNVIAKVDGSKTKYLVNGVYSQQELTSYGFVGLLATHNSVAYDHLITMDVISKDSSLNTLVPSQEYPNMALKLGYPNRSILYQASGEAYVIGDGTREVTFRSVTSVERVNKSAFVRIPNLTHKSFNGTQSSISKIVYQIPQFTNDGRQFGPLYFAPGEKTYIALHNPSKLILNDIEVQFVEANEKVVDSLTGSTQVVFHIRKRKE